MTLAALEEGITVVAETPVIDAGHTAVSTVVRQEQVQSLPINGRNFLSFTVITPGVTTDRTPQQGATATSGLSFTGQRGRSNNIMVDGFDNNDPTRRRRARDVQPGSRAGSSRCSRTPTPRSSARPRAAS